MILYCTWYIRCQLTTKFSFTITTCILQNGQGAFDLNGSMCIDALFYLVGYSLGSWQLSFLHFCFFFAFFFPFITFSFNCIKISWLISHLPPLSNATTTVWEYLVVKWCVAISWLHSQVFFISCIWISILDVVPTKVTVYSSCFNFHSKLPARVKTSLFMKN